MNPGVKICGYPLRYIKSMSAPTHIYTIYSPKRRKLYTGITKDPVNRLRQHNLQGRFGAHDWRYIYLSTKTYPRSLALRIESHMHQNKIYNISFDINPLREKAMQGLIYRPIQVYKILQLDNT